MCSVKCAVGSVLSAACSVHYTVYDVQKSFVRTEKNRDQASRQPVGGTIRGGAMEEREDADEQTIQYFKHYTHYSTLHTKDKYTITHIKSHTTHYI